MRQHNVWVNIVIITLRLGRSTNSILILSSLQLLSYVQICGTKEPEHPPIKIRICHHHSYHPASTAICPQSLLHIVSLSLESFGRLACLPLGDESCVTSRFTDMLSVEVCLVV